MTQLSTSINKFNFWFWSRIIKSVDLSIKSLCVFRIFTGLFLLLFYNPTFGWIGKSPDIFFRPPILSLSIFFDRFPGAGFFLLLDIIILICALCITLGIKAKLTSWIYILFSVIGLSFQYSFGKIDHSILIYALLFCFSFSGWGSELALIPDRAGKDSRLKSLSLFAVILCFAFFSAGFDKAINWINLDFNKSGTGSWFYSGFYSLDRQYLLAPYINHMPFWGFKIMDFIAVPFELSSVIFLLYSRKAWRIWLIIASLFHLTNLLVLNIPFLINAAAYLIFVDYSGIYSRLKKILNKKLYALLAGAGLTIVVLIRGYNIFNFKLCTILFIPDYHIIDNLVVSLIIWLLTTFILYRNTFRQHPASNASNSQNPISNLS